MAVKLVIVNAILSF